MWKILDTGPKSAQKNMELDRQLLDSLDTPLLHFYQWETESATYGYFIKPDRFLDLEKAKKWGLSFARRPTGGGIVFHSFDLAFSALLPSSHEAYSKNPLDNYTYINNLVLQAVKKFLRSIGEPNLLPEEPQPLDQSSRHFCMAKPTIYDVMHNGRKIAGAAQRNTRKGFLHQGTISIAPPKKEILRDVLLPNTQVLSAMEQNTFTLLGPNWTKAELEETRRELCHSLELAFNSPS